MMQSLLTCSCVCATPDCQFVVYRLLPLSLHAVLFRAELASCMFMPLLLCLHYVLHLLLPSHLLLPFSLHFPPACCVLGGLPSIFASKDHHYHHLLLLG